MRGPRLLTGYVIRVTVLGNRWHIVLVDLGRNSTVTFHDFGDLARHLELEAAKQAVGSPRGEP